MKKILLIDGHNLLFKMFFGMPFQFINENNVNITGTVGFIGAVAKLLKQFEPSECFVVFDSETSLEVRSEAEDYKAGRTDYANASDDENPFVQLEYIKKTLDVLHIRWIESKHFECDDYLALIAEKYDGKVFIVSTDTDFLQLVSDKVKCVLYKGNNSVVLDSEYVFGKFGVMPKDFALYKSLIGDKTDNIKGINKVGPKTAVSIINAISVGEQNKYSQLYNDSIDLINHNLSLITLPNSKIDKNRIILEDYRVDYERFKDFKVLTIVNSAIK